MEYIWHLLTLVGIYGALAVSLVVVVGDIGVFHVAQAAVFGLGAYASALVAIHLALPFELCLLIGLLSGGLLGFLVGLLSADLKRDQLVLAIAAIQLAFTGLASNLIDVTGGATGLVGIPGLSLLGMRIAPGPGMAAVSLVFLGISTLALWPFHRGSYADAVHCVRDEEIFARSLGLDPLRIRTSVFVGSGAVAGAAGAIFSAYMMTVDPTPFNLNASIMVLAMVAFGAARSMGLAVAGAVIIIGIPEALRFLGIPSASIGNVRQILAGSGLLLCALLFFERRKTRGRVGA